MTSMNNYDWRAKAAAMTASDDNDVEKAFMDQAYGWVANKAGQLMQDPNRLGFEIVDKNDGNTRMVGIFAFRINKKLLYVPVFFLNGEIKGTDLLYQCDTKTFKPLNKDWVTHLLEKGDQNDGTGISKDQRRQMPQDVAFKSLATPPGNKSASAEMLKAAGYDTWDAWIDEASQLTAPEPILQRFMLEDGGTRALDMIEKAASASYEFTEALVSHCDVEDYAPAGIQDFTKKASATTTLSLIVGQLPSNEKAASADPGFFKRGFMLLDDRDPLKSELSTVMEDDTQALEQFSGPGEYNVLMLDGSTEKAFVAKQNPDSFNFNVSNMPEAACIPPGYYDSDEGKMNTTAVVVLNGGKTRTCRDILGKVEKDINECCKKDGVLTDKMSAGNFYRIFDMGKGTLSRPFHVESKQTKKGITVYTIQAHYEEPIQLRHNPDFQGCDIARNIIGANARFIKVKASKEKCDFGKDQHRITEDSDFAVGDHDTLNQWITSTGTKKASIRKGKDGYFTIRIGEKTASVDMTAAGMAAFLARDLSIPGEVATDIVDRAAQDTRADVFIHAKSASAIRTMQEPDFQNGYDSVFGTEVDTPKNFELATDASEEYSPESRIGDGWDPNNADGLPGNVLSEAAPEALQQLAAMHKLPHVFEHGVVGSLTKTFDSVAMIDKYLPDLEKALDSMGRIIFLFYWKPSEFEDAYGTDDMSNLENELLSNFKQFGDMVLSLSKKAKIRRNGDSAPLTTS